MAEGVRDPVLGAGRAAEYLSEEIGEEIAAHKHHRELSQISKGPVDAE